jgi:hypothetical protein
VICHRRERGEDEGQTKTQECTQVRSNEGFLTLFSISISTVFLLELIHGSSSPAEEPLGAIVEGKKFNELGLSAERGAAIVQSRKLGTLYVRSRWSRHHIC